MIRHQLEHGGGLRRSAAAVASWARYDEGIDEQGKPIDIVDRLKDQLRAIAQHNRQRPLAFIENRELFGDLADHPRFVSAYQWALEKLHTVGSRATLKALR